MCTPAFWAIVAAAVTASLLPPWSSPSEISTMVAEPQCPRSGSSPSSPIVTDRPVIALSEPRMAAASDVPPEIRRFCTAALAAARSALGSEVVSAPWSKPTTPMSTVSGWASMNARRGLLGGRQPVGRDVVGAHAVGHVHRQDDRAGAATDRQRGGRPGHGDRQQHDPGQREPQPERAVRRPATTTPAAAQGRGPAPAREHGADDSARRRPAGRGRAAADTRGSSASPPGVGR